MFSPSKSGIMSPLTLSIEKHISNIIYHWYNCLRKLKWRIVTHDKNFTVSLLLEEKIITDLNTKYYFHGFFQSAPISNLYTGIISQKSNSKFILHNKLTYSKIKGWSFNPSLMHILSVTSEKYKISMKTSSVIHINIMYYDFYS